MATFKRGDKVVIHHPWDGSSLAGQRYPAIVAYKRSKSPKNEWYGVVSKHSKEPWPFHYTDMSTEFIKQYDFEGIDISHVH